MNNYSFFTLIMMSVLISGCTNKSQDSRKLELEVEKLKLENENLKLKINKGATTGESTETPLKRLKSAVQSDSEPTGVEYAELKSHIETYLKKLINGKCNLIIEIDNRKSHIGSHGVIMNYKVKNKSEGLNVSDIQITYTALDNGATLSGWSIMTKMPDAGEESVGQFELKSQRRENGLVGERIEFTKVSVKELNLIDAGTGFTPPRSRKDALENCKIEIVKLH